MNWVADNLTYCVSFAMLTLLCFWNNPKFDQKTTLEAKKQSHENEAGYFHFLLVYIFTLFSSCSEVHQVFLIQVRLTDSAVA